MREWQRDGFREILANQDVMKVGVSGIEKGISKIAFDVYEIKDCLSQSEVRQSLKSEPDWEEWVNVKAKLGHFGDNHYILIVDRFNEVNSEDIKALANVPWKLVIDLDPNSDIDGLLSNFNPSETKGGVVVTFTPSKLKDAHVDGMIDPQRMQWLFANGRNSKTQLQIGNQDDNEDKPKDNSNEWIKTYKKLVQELIRVCCQKLKSMKPVWCIVLGITRNVSIKIAKEILKEIYSQFSSKFSTNYLSFVPKPDVRKFDNGEISSLPPSLFLRGLRSLFGISEVTYPLPSSQKGLKIDLNQRQYNFLSEYLEVLYIGCEEIPSGERDKKNAFINQHLEKFLRGKAISFASLYYRHDAARNLTKEIYDRIVEMLYKIPKPRIVQVTHAPGSGGTTIARRVLWDLHDTHPCAIVKLDYVTESFGQNSEGEKYLNNLCERILHLEDKCNRTPVILIDGNSRQVRILSDWIVRKLEGKALILRCANYVQTADKKDKFQSHQADKLWLDVEDEGILSDRTDNFLHAEDDFKVNPILKDDENDYSGFVEKYDSHRKQLGYKDEAPYNDPQRVYHFPMMVMLDKFENLKGIVDDSLDILKKIPDSVEYSIATMVAFVQLYAKLPTPGSLVARFFKKNLRTNGELAKHFSTTLTNLLVPDEPPSITDFYSDYDEDYDHCSSENNTTESASSKSSSVLQSYSFQHRDVAKLVLDHSKKSVNEITEDFIRLKVLESYRRNDENRPLIENLFLYNKESTGAHFSKLVDELGKEANGGRIFEDAAKQTKDVKFFSHVARFYAYKGDFRKARDLIKDGFKAESNAPVEKKRGVVCTEGHIALMEMKHKNTEITDIECLKKLSKEALDLFRKARGNPPWTNPNPLIEEAMVWQFCFEWIIKNENGCVEEAVKFILKDSFFSGAIGESLYLMDEVDRIVETVPTLNDPKYTKFLANEGRRLLVQLIGSTNSTTERKGLQTVRIQRICEEIISKYKKIATEKDIIRLRVQWMLNDVDRKMFLLDSGDRVDLLSWLRRLVNDFKMFNHTRDLMEAAAEQPKPPFDNDEALKIIARWQEYCPNDPFSYLYMCMICFLEVHKGSIFEYRSSYESALENCTRKSQENSHRRFWQYFIGNGKRRKNFQEGSVGKDRDGVCALLTRPKLEAQYGKRRKNFQESSGSRRKEDVLDQEFWKNHCRDFLLECTGRIEFRGDTSKGKEIPYIMMEPGNLEIKVQKTSVGRAYMDYQPDSMVSFVVYFTLNGPIAKGIRFIDSKEKKRPMQSQLNRQGRKITNP